MDRGNGGYLINTLLSYLNGEKMQLIFFIFYLFLIGRKLFARRIIHVMNNCAMGVIFLCFEFSNCAYLIMVFVSFYRVDRMNQPLIAERNHFLRVFDYCCS